MKYTDQYMRRAYSRIQTKLYPDTVLFLGDLFDGGREWSTRTTKSPEKQYQQYGDSYWVNEYRRFGSIFFEHWGDGGMKPRPGQPGRKFISSLPGNHDLGFAKGVQIGVRDRFHAYFGDGNRIDVLGNHTFVSIDSVSLSALGVPSSQELEQLWRPTVDFLSGAKEQKKKLIQRSLRVQQGLKPYPGFAHREIPAHELAKATLPHATTQVTDFPTILLTHVPLYRAPGTPCGPLREHWPPSPPPPGQTTPLEHDERNAISVSGGYQYQNVMNKEISADIASKIGDIRYAFSGDDHDYCALVHRGYPSAGGGIRETTVKSISWAMGVRHPGVVLASLWNPVDATGNPLSGDMSKTVQTHLCLLPDQLGIFTRYAALFALTLLLLAGRAVLVASGRLASPSRMTAGLIATTKDAGPILPLAEDHHAAKHNPHRATDSLSSSSAAAATANPSPLLSRSTATAIRTRTASPQQPASAATYGYGLPAPLPHHQTTSYALPTGLYELDDKKDGRGGRVYGNGNSGGGGGSTTAFPAGKDKGRETRYAVFRREMRGSLGKVMVCGLGWYAWLVWRG